MGVEGGTSGGGLSGAASVSGPSINAPTFEVASAGPGGFNGSAEFTEVGKFKTSGPSVFGPEVKNFSSPHSDSLEEGFSLENSMTLAIGQKNPVSEIKFNDPVQSGAVPVEDLSVQDALAKAEAIIAQARLNQMPPQNPLKEEEVLAEANHWLGISEPKVAPIVIPNRLEYPTPQVLVSPVSEPTVKQVQILTTQGALKTKEQVMEELVEEKVMKDTKDTLEEEETVEKVKYLEDEQAISQRKYEIKEAVAKAKVEADRLGLSRITGWLVAKFLPAEHEGNRSQVVKKSGPDGSYQETVEAIAGVGELESNEKAVERFNSIVVEKKPVKYGKMGTTVAPEDVARVFKYRLIKPVQPHEEVVKRVLKKKVLAPQLSVAPAEVSEKKGIKVETSLEELNPALAEVFQKAA